MTKTNTLFKVKGLTKVLKIVIGPERWAVRVNIQQEIHKCYGLLLESTLT